MLLDYDEWMTNRVIDCAATLSDEQLDAEFDIGLRTVRTTLDHVIANIYFWSAMMAGTPGEIDRSDRSIPALRERHTRFFSMLRDVAERATDDGRLEATFRDHGGVEQTIGTTILHVTLHNHLHRSELLHMLQRLGANDLPDGDIQEWEHRSHRRVRQQTGTGTRRRADNSYVAHPVPTTD